ncbi:MAG: hypothetical protein ACK5RG_00425 [Cyclobacteriaceae bacterium]|nr:outer membrane beta-barrel protein [Flammeovirgaceae bacterium]
MRKLYVFILMCCLLLEAHGQGKKRAANFNATKGKANANQFIEQQWWLGFKSGINWAQADPLKRYTILIPTNYSSSLVEKKYDVFQEIGIQTTVEISYYYKGFYFSTQPGYISSTFTYSNQLQWINPIISNEKLTQTYRQSQKVEYAEFPFIIKYDITGSKLRPYVQVGIYYSVLLNAVKTVNVSSLDEAAGGTNTITSEPLIVGVKDLFSNYAGWMGGVGASYQLGNVRIVLDASYRQSLSNIVNPQNRFANDRLSGIGDAQDDLNLKNVVISAGVLFPLRYLSSNFKSNDR